jgi:threonine dehydratase
LSERIGGEVYLKFEYFQETGSFRYRGAMNKIQGLNNEERARGLITASSSNHGRALVIAAARLGVEATICLSSKVPEIKAEAIQKLGGHVAICGDSCEEADLVANQMRKDQGLTWVAPFDDPLVIAGQGTIGLEVMELCPQVDNITISLSGGGLFSGIATTAKAINPDVPLTGVTNQHGNGMLATLHTGKPVPVEEHLSLADCMAGTISPDTAYTFRIIQKLIDEAILINENEIPGSMSYTFYNDRLMMEGGSTLTYTPLLREDNARYRGKTLVLIITGKI